MNVDNIGKLLTAAGGGLAGERLDNDVAADCLVSVLDLAGDLAR